LPWPSQCTLAVFSFMVDPLDDDVGCDGGEWGVDD